MKPDLHITTLSLRIYLSAQTSALSPSSTLGSQKHTSTMMAHISLKPIRATSLATSFTAALMLAPATASQGETTFKALFTSLFYTFTGHFLGASTSINLWKGCLKDVRITSRDTLRK